MTSAQWTVFVLLLFLLFMETIIDKTVKDFFSGILNIFKKSSL